MSFHIKYRPTRLEDVIGQPAAIKMLRGHVDNKRSHAFLFSGPSGTGKTTLARIVAKNVGCMPRDILEIDAATKSGVDDMRAVQQAGQYKPLGKGTSRAIIVDECHRISRQAWDSLLKSVEEPPEHLFWFFCTTEPSKVPTTIRTRCATIALKAVNDKDLTTIVNRVVDKEQLELRGDILRLVTDKANGSPRQALVNLAAVLECETRKEAAAALQTVLESDPTLELCRLLTKGGSWKSATAIVAKMPNESAEGVRIVVANYMASCLKGANSDRDACHFLSILEQFATPYNSSENLAPLWLSIGRVLFADNG